MSSIDHKLSLHGGEATSGATAVSATASALGHMWQRLVATIAEARAAKAEAEALQHLATLDRARRQALLDQRDEIDDLLTARTRRHPK